MSIIQEALKKAQETYINTKNAKRNAGAIDSKKTAEEIMAMDTAVKAQEVKTKAPNVIMPPTMLIPVIIVLTILIGFGLKYIFSIRPAGDNKADKTHQEVLYKSVTSAQMPSKEAENLPQATTALSLVDTATSNIVSPVKSILPSKFGMAQTPDLTLNGIMYIKERPRAIINSNVVGEGDVVGGATVKTINKSDVLLNYNDMEITLKLKE